MAFKPFDIFVGGKRSDGWVSASLSRSKSSLTGELSATYFFGYDPTKPIFREAVRGGEIQAYVGGQLAFNGNIDKRKGSGSDQSKKNGAAGGGKQGGSLSVDISPDSYTVQLSARGKTKYLVNSSQEHPTGTLLQTTDKKVVEEMLKAHDVTLDWQGAEVQLNKAILRDGASILDELRRVSAENAHYIYETREGKMRVTDGPVGSGEALVLGDNILRFSAEQSEEQANSKVTVKGQRNDKNVRGKKAVIDRQKVMEDKWVRNHSPLIIQHYGDATDEALERRSKFETDKRAQESKKVTVEVFHVQSRTGEPWDIGLTHYVEIPPEGIFEPMECVEVNYKVENDKTLKTTLTLAALPASTVSGGAVFGSTTSLGKIGALSDDQSRGRQRGLQLGVTLVDGQYPDPWGSAELSFTPVPEFIEVVAAPILSSLVSNLPPLVLPEEFSE